VVENLAKDLRAEFPGVGGFSAANLWRIKQFYEAYAKDEKLAPLVREISWTKNLVILEQCKDSAERQFYLERTKQFGWAKNVLIHQIENKTFEKTLLNQTNFEVALPAHIRNQAKLAVKDEYTFDFLELAAEHSERQLEQAILARVEPFLLEMGGMFSFVGSQYRLEVGGKQYFIDLLLFHRRLRLLVALNLALSRHGHSKNGASKCTAGFSCISPPACWSFPPDTGTFRRNTLAVGSSDGQPAISRPHRRLIVSLIPAPFEMRFSQRGISAHQGRTAPSSTRRSARPAHTGCRAVFRPGLKPVP
jgi:predicted nuclease of restriction endonuclease-like (RecB) superfamily